MKAILWDGNKQLEGELLLTEKELSFELLDFKKTDLNFSLPYSSIVKVHQHNLYDLTAQGIEICSDSGKRNVFVVEDATKIIRIIQKTIRKIKVF